MTKDAVKRKDFKLYWIAQKSYTMAFFFYLYINDKYYNYGYLNGCRLYFT